MESKDLLIFCAAAAALIAYFGVILVPGKYLVEQTTVSVPYER